jgi:hypothetical protein
MLFSVLLSVVLAAPTGTIEVRFVMPANAKLSRPAQVVVFPHDYVNVYMAELQKNLDDYWEEFKDLFIHDKQAFLLFRERAKHRAMDYTLDRMKRENPLYMPDLLMTTSASQFTFRHVPQGECEVVALVTIGNQESVWSETLILRDAPATVALQPTNP